MSCSPLQLWPVCGLRSGPHRHWLHGWADGAGALRGEDKSKAQGPQTKSQTLTELCINSGERLPS